MNNKNNNRRKRVKENQIRKYRQIESKGERKIEKENV